MTLEAAIAKATARTFAGIPTLVQPRHGGYQTASVAAQLRYNHGAKRKASKLRYDHSAKGKAAQLRYERSAKGKAAKLRYNHSAEYAAVRERYENSPYGIVKMIERQAAQRGNR